MVRKQSHIDPNRQIVLNQKTVRSKVLNLFLQCDIVRKILPDGIVNIIISHFIVKFDSFDNKYVFVQHKVNKCIFTYRPILPEHPYRYMTHRYNCVLTYKFWYENIHKENNNNAFVLRKPFHVSENPKLIVRYSESISSLGMISKFWMPEPYPNGFSKPWWGRRVVIHRGEYGWYSSNALKN